MCRPIKSNNTISGSLQRFNEPSELGCTSGPAMNYQYVWFRLSPLIPLNDFVSDWKSKCIGKGFSFLFLFRCFEIQWRKEKVDKKFLRQGRSDHFKLRKSPANNLQQEWRVIFLLHGA